jgi:hypothetical protein
LNRSDSDYLSERTAGEIRSHAHQIVKARLSAALPANDGGQTPMRGHPVFVAQHATGTCCRECLKKWHKIEQGRTLAPVEIDYIVDVIVAWIEDRRTPSRQVCFDFGETVT